MKSDFRAAAVLLLTLLLTSQSASAATTSGSTALALAALVGAQSPALSRDDKSVLARLLDGDANVRFPDNKQISVQTDAIDCTPAMKSKP
jgi:hypothetical protein